MEDRRVYQELQVYCDEAGSTGAALLDPEQRYFAFGSVAISNTEASELITTARSQFPVQMPELKAAKLFRTPRGCQLIEFLLTQLEGRYAVVAHDKLFALCAQFFEYVYEPMFKESPWILYSKKLHLYVAMVLYAWFQVHEGDAKQVLNEFEAYLRSLDPDQAPILFGKIIRTGARNRDPMDFILQFARTCRQEIVRDNATLPNELPAEARWLGDLATTSLWAHLNHWGSKCVPIALTCDVSKPLQANIGELTGGDDDPGVIRARKKNQTGPLGWRFARPVMFANSKSHPALQIADVIAGAAVFAIRNAANESSGLDGLKESVDRHVLPQCMLPNFRILDPNSKEAMVSASILYRLYQKADAGWDLRENLELEYAMAENHWDHSRFGRPA